MTQKYKILDQKVRLVNNVVTIGKNEKNTTVKILKAAFMMKL